VWIGGDVTVSVLGRMFGLPANDLSYVVIYGLLAAATVAGAVYGYKVLLAMSRVLAVGMTALLILGVIAYAPGFTTAALPDAGGYLLGGFWPTWLLAAVAAGLSGPVAFITLLGDYTRYISPARHSSRTVLRATWLGLLLGLLVPQLFGTFTSYAAKAALDYAGPLAASAPAWYLLPLLIAASAGSVGNAGLMLYSMGLDLDAILPRLSRAKATCVVAVVATVSVFLGHYFSDTQSAMTSFVLLLTAIGTPWAVVTLIGFVRCRGVYDADALQVFNRRARAVGGGVLVRGETAGFGGVPSGSAHRLTSSTGTPRYPQAAARRSASSRAPGASSGPSTSPAKPIATRSPPIGTRPTSPLSPGPKRTDDPAGTASRMP
jgi:purine-cytosine permease-like protein